MKKALFFLLILSFSSMLFAQQKYALVIGNSNYTGISRLTNPANDANDMETALKGLGFSVEKLINGNLDQMERAIINFTRRLGVSRNTYGFFFYAGHGVQSNGENYLIPIDASGIQSENHLRQRAVSVQTMLDNMNEAGNELNMIVLDACRDNPFGWNRSGSRGLSVVSRAPTGSIVMYATSANSVADDGTGRNGLFTGQLLNNLKTPGLSVQEIFNKTGEDVIRVSNGRQHPEISLRFFGATSTYLGNRPTPQPAPAPHPSPSSAVTPQPQSSPRLQQYENSRFFGTWRPSGRMTNGMSNTSNSTIIITNNEFRLSDTIGGSRHLYFTITNWNTIRNQDSRTSTDYPTGFALTGMIASVSGLEGYRGATTLFLFLHNNGQSLIWGENSRSEVILNLGIYIKQ